VFNNINQFCQNYYNQLPPNLLRTIGCNAAASFVASVCVLAVTSKPNQAVDLSRAVFATCIGITATLVHALTTPLFNDLFNVNNQTFNGYLEFTKIITNITLTQILINYTTAYKINLITAFMPKNDNFIILPNTIVKILSDMYIKAFDILDPNFALHMRQQCHQLGIDFNTNSTPVYICV
jgi:hypothetical protein